MKLVFNDYTEEDLIYVYSLSFSHTIRTILLVLLVKVLYIIIFIKF